MPGDFGLLIWLLLIAWFAFIIWRGFQVRQRQQRMLSELQPGDEVVTTGGLIGTVRTVREDRVEIDAGPNVRLWLVKGAVASRRSGEEQGRVA